MIEKKPRKEGSGRKTGAVSCCEVPLSELNKLFKPDYPIPVWRKWADQNKLKGTPITAKLETLITHIPLETTEIHFEKE